jgi:hypothetical protein
LRLVLLAPLQQLQRLLLQRRFAGPVAHLGHALLVGRQFGVELGQLDVEALDVRVDLLGLAH